MGKVISAFLLSFSIVFSQELNHIKDILNFTENIMSSLPEEKTLKTVEKNAINKRTVKTFKKFLSEIKDKKIIGYRKFHTKEIYDLLFKVSYIVKYKNGVSVIVFYFYKPEQKWFLYDLSFDNDVKSFF